MRGHGGFFPLVKLTWQAGKSPVLNMFRYNNSFFIGYIYTSSLRGPHFPASYVSLLECTSRLKITLPETNIAPENNSWKRRFLLETIIFRCYVSSRVRLESGCLKIVLHNFNTTIRRKKRIIRSCQTAIQVFPNIGVYTPKWMLYNGNPEIPIKMDDLGVTENPILGSTPKKKPATLTKGIFFKHL